GEHTRIADAAAAGVTVPALDGQRADHGGHRRVDDDEMVGPCPVDGQTGHARSGDVDAVSEGRQVRAESDRPGDGEDDRVHRPGVGVGCRDRFAERAFARITYTIAWI